MSDHFHIGCRVEDIEFVCPNKGGTDYKTSVRFRSGTTALISGTWDENEKKISAKLERLRKTGEAAEENAARLRIQASELESEIVRLEQAKAVAERACRAAPVPQTALHRLCALVLGYVESGRNYMLKHEREECAALIAELSDGKEGLKVGG